MVDQSPQFDIPLITEDSVLKELQSLDIKKSTGLDGIGSKFLKISAKIISKPITYSFSQSITNCQFPSLFKQAKVIPIYKKRF